MSSQQANLDTLSGLTGLAHTVYLNKIVKHLAHLAPIAGLFRRGRRGSDYKFAGTSITWGGDLYQSGGAMATPAGQLPDTQHQDAVQFSTSPTRAYVRRAWDRFVSTLGVAPGTFQDYLPRLMEQATEAWQKMVTRHVHGSSTAVVCVVASRTSDTVIVVKDGYGHVGTNPLMFIEKGDILVWHDATDSFAAKGAAKVLSLNYATKTITFASAFDDGSTIPAAADVISFATTTGTAPLTTTADYFASERNSAPLGFRNHLDPDSASSSYCNVAEATHIRSKPLRKTSSSFDEIEFMDFIGELEAHGSTTVTPNNYVATCQRAVLNELARSLTPSTQIMGKGAQTPLSGGWDPETINIGGHRFLVDGFHTQDELMMHCLDDYIVADITGEDGAAQTFAGDGSDISRLEDFDAVEQYQFWYGQRFLDRRNRSGTLKGISISNYTADQFAAVPR